MNYYPSLYHDAEYSGLRLLEQAIGRTISATEDEVCILLALCNGASFIGDQLESFARQTLRSWSLIVSDDGSSDRGADTALAFARSMPGRDIRIVDGPGRGFQANFLSLALAAGPNVPFAAFSDQDDRWMPGKLARALAVLQHVPADCPALYCGRTVYTDAALRPEGFSPLFAEAPGFGNALVQSIAGGNTMVLNRAALDLLQFSAVHVTDVPSHDWWAYLLISGSGGKVFYDPVPQVFYRQHGRNQVGSNIGWAARTRRLRSLLEGRFKCWSDANIAALQAVRTVLAAEAIEQLDTFAASRGRALPHRLAGAYRAGLYRQTRAGRCALWAAAALGRI